MSNYREFLKESIQANFNKRLDLKSFWNANFLILTAAGVAACSSGGGGGATAGVVPRPIRTLNTEGANTGTARSEVFPSDGTSFLAAPHASFSLNGAGEIDELRLSEAGVIDLPDYAAMRGGNPIVSNIEIINTQGGGVATIQLNAATVNAFSGLVIPTIPGNTTWELLIIRNDPGETVDIEGEDWTLLTGTNDIGVLQFGGVNYNLFYNGSNLGSATALIAVAGGRSVVDDTAPALSTTGTTVSHDVNLHNILFGTDGVDPLTGGTRSDYIYGGNGNDTLSGGGGDDYLYGGENDDRLAGGNGEDSLRGGLGSDTFIFLGTNNAGDDTILDFSTAQNDSILLRGSSANITALRTAGATDAFFDAATTNNIFTAGLDAAFSFSLLAARAAIDGTTMVRPLEVTITAGPHNVTVGSGASATTVAVTLAAQTFTVVPTADFSNLMPDLQTGVVDFAEFVAALGGGVGDLMYG